MNKTPIAYSVNLPSFNMELYAFLSAVHPARVVEIMEATTITPSSKGFYYHVHIDAKTVIVQLYDNTVLRDERSITLEEIDALYALENTEKGWQKTLKRATKRLILDLSKKIGGYQSPWGVLIGIRPTKLIFKFWSMGYEDERIHSILLNEYAVSKEKIDLLFRVAYTEHPYHERKHSGKQIYIHIPFCPSRCSYCTFPTTPAQHKQDLMEKYLRTLVKELNAGQNHFRDIDSIYIGGGTPSVYKAKSIELLLKTIADIMGPSIKNIEYIFEAGRADTITREKLEILKKYGVNRLSINPQTMQDRTLALIGRNHHSRDVIESYKLAKSIGFRHINMDLIMGLPGETISDMMFSLDHVIRLNPESITVHTLAIKKGSALDHGEEVRQLDGFTQLLNDTSSILSQEGYHPYYLYRQKHMVGQFENVGYAKDHHECIYNIFMMEEWGDVIAFGAGAINKRIRSGKIKRLDQPKHVETYFNHIEQIIEKKIQFFDE